MNKKAELVLISIVIGALVLTGFAILKDKIDKNRVIHYVGDKSTTTAYNLDSKNKNCDLNKVVILKENIILFENDKQAKSQGFKINPNCD